MAIAGEVGKAGGFLQSVIEAHPLDEEMRIMQAQLASLDIQDQSGCCYGRLDQCQTTKPAMLK